MRNLPLATRYVVHSAFLTVQGEGLHAGKRAVFVRLSGCNVWTGLEQHRERDAAVHSACAAICDTEFKGTDPSKNGGVYTKEDLVDLAGRLWGSYPGEAMVVFTGGEPTLQLDAELVTEFRLRNFYVAVETNGTGVVPSNVHWIAISPKFPMPIKPGRYDEVKLLSIFLSEGYYVNLATMIPATFHWVQPVDHRDEDKNRLEMMKASQFVMNTPGWRLGLQAHKLWGVD